MRVAAFKRFSHCTTLAACYYIPSFFRAPVLSPILRAADAALHTGAFSIRRKYATFLLKREVWISFESFSRQPTTTIANSPTGGAQCWQLGEREKKRESNRRIEKLDRQRERAETLTRHRGGKTRKRETREASSLEDP